MTRADDAAQLWGGRISRPIALRENEIFELALPQARAALRLHRQGYQTAATIRSELWWCAALADQGLPVPRPVALPAGALYAKLADGGLASCVTWVAGEPLGAAGVALPQSPARQVELHHALGQLIAQVHRATQALTLPDWFTRPAWNRDGLVGDAPLWGRFWDHPNLTEPDRETLTHARHWLSDDLAQTASPQGLIHADVLRENVLVDGDRLSLIDFDDSGTGYLWHDLGTVLSQCLYEPAYPDIRAALADGYGIAADQVDRFTLARCLASVGWAMTRLPLDHPVQASHIARAVMVAKRLIT